ncbi:RNA-binding domain-containing protein [Amniculicola lignicola CBS 123094]|uniref:RNA-binding domain-containing protein n=1 Tax=Amniculicola lignicola CBS 123094 TaxID=1392246 RepID=A0A6A5WNU6_9PLEO|nr:RNA-binding domain-containing protein [Amniculicola lignicola CBS 123094]
MSSKLATSLDDIVKTAQAEGLTPQSRRGRRDRRGGRGGAGPVGGIQKSQPAPRKQGKPAAPAPAAAGDSVKLLITGLPDDIEEKAIQEFFTSTKIGRAKRVILSYNKNGNGNGNATVIFHKAEQAQKAVEKMDGNKIDGRPIRVELVLSPAVAPIATKPLAERLTGPKKAQDKPKPATATKGTGAGARGRDRGRGRGRGGRGGREPRVPRTHEELDKELADINRQNGRGDADMVTDGATGAGGDTVMDEAL